MVKERPPANNIEKYISFNNRGAAVTTQAYLEYERQLYAELSECKASVIVPLGNVPLYALTRKKSVTKWRNSILESEQLGGRKVIPTIHPAAALRDFLSERLIVHDLMRVLAQSSFTEVRRVPDNFIIRPDYNTAIGYMRDILDNRITNGFDVEIVNEELSCFSFAKSAHDAICIPFVQGSREYWGPDQELEIMLLAAEILERADIVKVGQNLSFDAHFQFRKYGIRMKNMEDTMIAAGILYPDYPKGLDFLCTLYTERSYYKDEGKRWKNTGISDEDFWLYNCRDSASCMEIFPQQKEELEIQGNWETYCYTRDLIPAIVYMEERGILVDVGNKKKASEEADEKILRLTAELQELCGSPINPNSPAQLKEYFYVKRGLKPYVKKGGILSVDEIALKRIARKGIPEAKIVQEIRRTAKLKGTYFDMLIDDDNRLRCSINVVGTKTGRYSSSKNIFGTGGNMQNLPRTSDFKRFLCADPGCIIYNVDLSQAENRIVAYIAPEPTMIFVFENGIDAHKKSAALIFDIPIEDISDEPGSCPLGLGEDSQRDWGKKANHALDYNMGYRQFSILYDLPETEGKFIVEKWHRGYPGIRGKYYEWVKASLAKDRSLTNCFGRRRIFCDRWGDLLFNESYAQIPQSSVADKINRQGMRYLWYNPDMFRDFDLLNQVHDSIMGQMAVSLTFQHHAAVLLDLMNNLETPVEWQGQQFKIPADLSMGLNAKELKKVKCERTVDAMAAELERVYTSLTSK